MKTIHKFPLKINDYVWVEMPIGARILTVQEQRGSLTVWAEVDTDNRMATRKFAVRGTGHPLFDEENGEWVCDDDWKYISTVQTYEGRLVWHIYDCGEE